MNYYTHENTDGQNTDCELRIINRKLEIAMEGISKTDPNYDEILKSKAEEILRVWES